MACQGLFQAVIDGQHRGYAQHFHGAQDARPRQQQPQLGAAGSGLPVGQHEGADTDAAAVAA